ncbi:hypothetical protein TBLA_0D02670 [Henningerozyma blattae CBS 6284]|uniref:Ubiquitin-like protease family profile domain-containing protein n=1 Tax=Henningerozyma blattae (strain ATCC 34711 / CBS 6284 / DSM 70876 / NBRC 10599 / NRRL Y-10934 / UCD 77-7) TaxID=1071380 RepID=I2H318_HENB6|nr:hypothetical protein TBLA_0D02670 [Tetrapisispora blattae CBS 6284]CCH60770.1 hypothetical protein TBLA_0D02670 [Tetrapisispora blattae CBS 6284]
MGSDCDIRRDYYGIYPNRRNSYYSPVYSTLTTHSSDSSLFNPKRKFPDVGIMDNIYTSRGIFHSLDVVDQELPMQMKRTFHNGHSKKSREDAVDQTNSSLLRSISNTLLNTGKQFWESLVGSYVDDNTLQNSVATEISTNEKAKKRKENEYFFIQNKKRKIILDNLANISFSRSNHSNEENLDSSSLASPPSSSSISSSVASQDLQPRCLSLSKYPFNWDGGKITKIGEKDSGEINGALSYPQYGTTFIGRSKARRNYSHANPVILRDRSDEIRYLKMIFNGKYEIPEILKNERQRQLNLLRQDKKSYNKAVDDQTNNDNELKSSIIDLTSKIKNAILDSRKPSENKVYTNDDIVLLKEQKLTPLEKRNKEFQLQQLRFNRYLVSLEKESKNIKQMRDEREKLMEELRKNKEAETEVKILIPMLTEAEINRVNSTINRKDNGVLLDKDNLEIRVHDIKTLAPRRWLNDTIIEFFMKYIEKNSPNTVAFNSFFYSSLSERGYQGVRRWMKRKKVQIEQLEKIFFPINLNQSHWALCMADLKLKKIFYVDSLSNGPNAMSYAILTDLQNYIIEESKHKLGEEFDLEHLECPQQPNGFDCGIYVCMNALYLSNDSDLTFNNKDAARMRQYVVSLVLAGNDK